MTPRDEGLLDRLHAYQEILGVATAQHYKLPPDIRRAVDSIPREAEYARLAVQLAGYSGGFLHELNELTSDVIWTIEDRTGLTVPGTPDLRLVGGGSDAS